MTDLVVDLFAGPGGWDEGLRQAGITNVVGFEWDQHACATAAAAGHQRVRADVARIATQRIVTKMWGLVASTPCTKFSPAGDGMGRRFLALLADGIRALFRGEDRRQQIRDAIFPACLAKQAEKNAARPEGKRWPQDRMEQAARDEAQTIVLVLEPARFAADALAADGPLDWMLLEQVPEVLPLWQIYKECLSQAGFSTWCGVLNSADHGVPQTRERAILIASRSRVVGPPVATHAKDPAGEDLFGGQALPWVSMADALGWGMTARPYFIIACSRTTGGPDKEKVGGSGARRALYAERDSGRWRPGPPEPDGAIRVTLQQAGILQSFPPDYPWQGNKTAQFQQVGNAVPPRLAAAVAAVVAVPQMAVTS